MVYSDVNVLKDNKKYVITKKKKCLYSCVAERAFLRTLEGGCSAPVAVESRFLDDVLYLKGGVWSLDGKRSITQSLDVKLAVSLMYGHLHEYSYRSITFVDQ